jgi:hypothetical protein
VLSVSSILFVDFWLVLCFWVTYVTNKVWDVLGVVNKENVKKICWL